VTISDSQSAPLFSIITVCRNAEATIKRTIQSVLDQSFTDYEYLVIDGASSDKTLRHVQGFASAFDGTNSGILHYSSEADQSIYDAMNKGLARARGSYVAFLNADDWYSDDALITVASLTSSSIDCIAGATRVFSLDGSSQVRPARKDVLLQPYPPAMPATHQSWFARTELLRMLGGFNTDFTIAADYELFLRIHKLNRLWAFSPEVLANFSLGGASYDIVPTAMQYAHAKRANGDSIVHAWGVYLRNVSAAFMRRIVARTTQR